MTLFVDNAFNILYARNVDLSGPQFGLFSGACAPPRMFGVRLRYAFGGG